MFRVSDCYTAVEIEELCAIAQGYCGVEGLKSRLGMAGAMPYRAPGRDGRHIGRLDRVEDPGSGRKGTVSRVVLNPVLEVLWDGGGTGLVRACSVERSEDERPAIEVEGRAVEVGDRLWHRCDGTPLTVSALAPERGRVVAVERIALYPGGPKVDGRREYSPKDLTYREPGSPQGDGCCLKCRYYDGLGDGVGVCRYRTVPTGTLEAFSPVVSERDVCGAVEEAAEDEWDS